MESLHLGYQEMSTVGKKRKVQTSQLKYFHGS